MLQWWQHLRAPRKVWPAFSIMPRANRRPGVLHSPLTVTNQSCHPCCNRPMRRPSSLRGVEGSTISNQRRAQYSYTRAWTLYVGLYDSKCFWTWQVFVGMRKHARVGIHKCVLEGRVMCRRSIMIVAEFSSVWQLRHDALFRREYCTPWAPRLKYLNILFCFVRIVLFSNFWLDPLELRLNRVGGLKLK